MGLYPFFPLLTIPVSEPRTKSYAEKLSDRQERMNTFDKPEVVFMPGEDLSDNDDEDKPMEVATKKEVLPLFNEDEAPLPDVEVGLWGICGKTSIFLNKPFGLIFSPF